MTVTPTQIILTTVAGGETATYNMAYSNVQFFGFNLGTGQDSVTVSGTTVRINRDDALTPGTALTIDSDGTFALGDGLTKAVQVSARAISPTGKLDLGDGQLVLDGSQDSYANVKAWLTSGYNASGTHWTGPGIDSSTVASDVSSHVHHLGLLQGQRPERDRQVVWPGDGFQFDRRPLHVHWRRRFERDGGPDRLLQVEVVVQRGAGHGGGRTGGTATSTTVVRLI